MSYGGGGTYGRYAPKGPPQSKSLAERVESLESSVQRLWCFICIIMVILIVWRFL